MVAGLVFARHAVQISSDHAVVFLLQGRSPPSQQIPMAARPATRSRKRSSRDSSSWWRGMHTRSGGTIGCSGRSWISARLMIPMFATYKMQLAQTGRRLWVLDVTSDLGIPTFVAITHWTQNGRENIEFGSGAHFDPRIALLRALTEVNQFLSLGLMGGGTGEKSSLDGAAPLRLEDHPYLIPSGGPMAQSEFGSKFGHLDTREQVAGVRFAREASGPRFPRPRSDASRHRGAGRQSDRSGIAAFLPPLRAWSALRCAGEAWIA